MKMSEKTETQIAKVDPSQRFLHKCPGSSGVTKSRLKKYHTSLSFDMGLPNVDLNSKILAQQLDRQLTLQSGTEIPVTTNPSSILVLDSQDHQNLRRNSLRTISLVTRDVMFKTRRNISRLAQNRNMLSFEGPSYNFSGLQNHYAKELTIGGVESDINRTTNFLAEFVSILLRYIKEMSNRNMKVLDFYHPHQMREILAPMLEIPNGQGVDLAQILKDCEKTLKYGVRTGHPRFFNQLSSGLDIISMAGEWLTSTSNTNMFTYEIAPVFTIMEEEILKHMRKIIGWESGDGILAPGGAISNLYAVLAARYDRFPCVKDQGMYALPRLIMFTSEHAHYSIKRAAAISGIGTANIRYIKCNHRGEMIPNELEVEILKAKRENAIPFFISVCGGTTVLGAFDPIDEIVGICRRHHLWIHCDCAWGGGVLMSRKHRYLVKGIEKVDSVTWNPHKAMGTTLQCSAILLRKPDILENCNSMAADYLFQKDKQYDTAYDTGDKTIQCGRHNDIFKLWLMWRAKGDQGFEDQILKLYSLTEYLKKEILRRDGFLSVLENPDYFNVCFWYIPKNFRELPRGPETSKIINMIAPRIKAIMMERGTTMVGYQPLGELPNFFRMIISNVASEESDIDFLLDEIESYGEEISGSLLIQ